MKYDFDKIINRRNINCVKWDCKENELPMWIADMDFETAPEIKQAILERASNGTYGYSDITPDFFDAVIRYWKVRHNFSIKKEWIIFSTGVIPSVSTAVRKFTTPAEKIVVQTPVYNIFFNSIINNGRRILENPLIYKDGKYSMDFDDLEEKLKDPLTTMMILCNPHNPAGKTWNKDELAKVGELCSKYGVTVFSDEIHCDFTKPGISYTPFASVNETNASISITAVAPGKTFNTAGLNTSCVIVPNKNLFNRMNRALNTDECAEPNVFAIQTAVTAYTKCDEWVNELVEYVFKNRKEAEDFIDQNIKNVKAVKSDATYLIWIDCTDICKKNNFTSETICEILQKETGLILNNGNQYGGSGKYFLRMNLACPNALLKDGLKRLQYLNNL